MIGKRILSLGLVLVMVLAATGFALADTTDTSDATATITAGSLATTAHTVITLAATLAGADQTVYDSDTTAWTAEDWTGSGDGWHVNISATTLCDTARDAGCTDPEALIPLANFKVKLDAGNITDTAGSSVLPTTQIAAYTALGAAQSLLSAAATGEAGMGAYEFTPDFSLFVAAEEYAGTYTSTVTVEILTTP